MHANPRVPLSKLLHSQDAVQGFGTRVDTLGTIMKEARDHTESSRTHNKVRINKKANAGLIEPGDMVVLLAPEPLTLTSKWDPQWQVTRVFLRHQQSGHTKKVHRSKVKLVDPDMVWDEIAPRPRRKQHRGGPLEAKVNIHVDTPTTNIDPPRGDPLAMGNPQCLDLPQTSHSENMSEMESEESLPEPPSTWTDPVTTPVETPDVDSGFSLQCPIRGRLPVARESERGSKHGQKRELSPGETITTRCTTRWSSLSDEEKRRKRVRYDVLAGRTSKFNSIGSTYTVC